MSFSLARALAWHLGEPENLSDHLAKEHYAP